MTQAGDPLADGRKGFGHRISDHRFVLAAFALAAHSADKQAAVAEFRVAQMFSEGAGDALLVAERDPVAEGGRLGVSVFGGVGLAGELESRFEINLESKSDSKCTSCHGLCCGHCNKK